MKYSPAFFATFFLVIYCSTNAHAQWTALPSNTTDPLYDLFFITPDTGFVVGDSPLLFKTTDGGTTWNTINLNAPENLGAVHFPSKKVGYMNGFKTTDMGATWTPLEDPEYSLNALYFINDTIGFHSFNGGLGKTVDGGYTWAELPMMHFTVVEEEFVFSSDSVGYVVGWYSGSIHKTTDQGTTWSLVDEMNAYAIQFPSPDTGYVVGWYGVIKKTTDAGLTWQVQTAGLTTDRVLHDIVCLDHATCYAVGDSGVIVKTTDGGQHWVYQHSGTTEELYAVFFTDAQTGFIVGANGTILKTTNGGVTGTRTVDGAAPGLAVFPNPAADFSVVRLPVDRDYNFLTVFDLLGRAVQRIAVADGQSEVRLNPAALLPGVYFLAPGSRLEEAVQLVVRR